MARLYARKVARIDPDAPGYTGKPMVRIRLECDHEFRTCADRAPAVGEIRYCSRCRGRGPVLIGSLIAGRLTMVPEDRSPPESGSDAACPQSSLAPVPKACSSCGAPIFWAQNDDTGKSMPVDAAPSDSGNVVLYKRGSQTIAKVLKKNEATRPSEKRRVSHFATCPNAQQHRKGTP